MQKEKKREQGSRAKRHRLELFTRTIVTSDIGNCEHCDVPVRQKESSSS